MHRKAGPVAREVGFFNLQLGVTKRMLTIDIEAVLVQAEGAQLGDPISPTAQVPVQTLSVQPKARGVRTVSADSINSSGCSVLLRPAKEGTQKGEGVHSR